jgi:hypothetical protein
MEEAAAFSLWQKIFNKPPDASEVVTECMEHALKLLPARQTQVLKWHFGTDGEGPYTHREISDFLQVSASQISLIESKALQTLRRPIFSRRYLAASMSYKLDWMREQVGSLLYDFERLNESVAFLQEYAELSAPLRDAVALVVSRAKLYGVQAGSHDSQVLIKDMALTTRTQGTLRRHGLQTLWDLRSATDEYLLKIRNFGRASLLEVKLAMDAYPAEREIPVV